MLKFSPASSLAKSKYAKTEICATQRFCCPGYDEMMIKGLPFPCQHDHKILWDSATDEINFPEFISVLQPPTIFVIMQLPKEMI